MKWWHWHRHYEEHDPAADDALASALEAKARAEAQWPKVHRLAASIQAHRDANHFAEMFSRAMQRRES